jgi:hypothetical protein
MIRNVFENIYIELNKEEDIIIELYIFEFIGFLGLVGIFI